MSAFGAVISYLKSSLIDTFITDQKKVENVQPVLQAKKSYVNDTNSLIPRGKFMVLDSKTMKHLDVIPHAEQSGKHTLFSVMDHTITHMGRRLLRQWVCIGF